MESTNLAIGVFDSGMGGLTVLRALRERLPQESFIYLGDTARLPYGTKSEHTVQQYAMQMAKILVERQIKALVIACNTATTAALTHLQSMLTDMPVSGVISPGASAAIAATKNQHIAVLATETTIATNAYQHQIKAQLPMASIQTRVCSLLVALAEEGMVNNHITEATLKHYLNGLVDADTLLLGCTHFPVFKPILTKMLPFDMQVVDSAQSTANVLANLLNEKQLLNQVSAKGDTHYLVTDSVERFRRIGAIFLEDDIVKSDVELVDV